MSQPHPDRPYSRPKRGDSPANGFTVSELLSYPAAGEDSGFRYITAILLTLVSFTIAPVLFFIGFLWRTAYWSSHGRASPPPVSNWRANLAAGGKGLVTGIMVFVVPFVVLLHVFWTVAPTQPTLLETARTAARYVVSSYAISLYLGTSLFINCAQQNSLKPIISLKPYRDLVSLRYLRAWAIVIAISTLFLPLYAVLGLLSIIAVVPSLLLVASMFYHAIFGIATISTALSPHLE